jgi:hypothetical protein
VTGGWGCRGAAATKIARGPLRKRISARPWHCGTCGLSWRSFLSLLAAESRLLERISHVSENNTAVRRELRGGPDHPGHLHDPWPTWWSRTSTSSPMRGMAVEAAFSSLRVSAATKTVPLDRKVLQERYDRELRPNLVARQSWHDGTLEMWMGAYFKNSK